MHFEDYGLKRLITTCYKNQDVDLFSTQQSEQAVYLVYDGDKNGNGEVDVHELDIRPLKGDGDFRSKECIALLEQADIVVTNPPFSLFREYVAQLMKYQKKFLIIGNQGAIGYKEIFPLIKENKVWLGFNNGDMAFKVPADSEPKQTRYWQDADGQKWRSMGNIAWYTNLDHDKRHEPLILYRKYREEDYSQYDNYDAIEVGKAELIPEDYNGLMGIPITFLDKYCPDQFEILGICDRTNSSGLRTKKYTIEDCPNYNDVNRAATILKDGKYKSTFTRILIRRKQ